MPALSGSALGQPAHELGQRADVERSVFHVVVDVVGPGLGHLHARFKIGGHALVPARVVDWLSLRQQIDRLTDSLGLLGGGSDAQQEAYR